MSRRLVRLAAVGAAALAVGALGAQPASAVQPFGGAQVLVPGCGGTGGDARGLIGRHGPGLRRLR